MALIIVPIIKLEIPFFKDKRFWLIVSEYAIHRARSALQKNSIIIGIGKSTTIKPSQLNKTSSRTVTPNRAKMGFDFVGFMSNKTPPYNCIKQIISGMTWLK